jgi:hypothetical protein
LISDGYGAYQDLLPQLAGVQQCCQHVIRRCRAVTKLGPGSLQSWAGDVIDILREAHQAVQDARARGDPALDAELLDKLRQRYDEAAAFGITHNRHRDWHDGNHPGYALGCWLRDYKEQVWPFTTQSRVEWTNNCSEQAARTAKRHQAVSGYWHTPRTLARWCRIRSYLDSAANHGLTALDAITRALAGDPGSRPQPLREITAHRPPLNGHLDSVALPVWVEIWVENRRCPESVNTGCSVVRFCAFVRTDFRPAGWGCLEDMNAQLARRQRRRSASEGARGARRATVVGTQIKIIHRREYGCRGQPRLPCCRLSGPQPLRLNWSSLAYALREDLGGIIVVHGMAESPSPQRLHRISTASPQRLHSISRRSPSGCCVFE